MSVPVPHFVLFSAADQARDAGDWRFVLQAADGSHKVEVADAEPDVQGERLELLAVVRGLEALDQPSRVTLVTPSKYVTRGLKHGLEEWRANEWQWERHGEMVPVKNLDLWQRVDRALAFHRIECRSWRLDSPHVATSQSSSKFESERREPRIRRQPASMRHRRRRWAASFRRWFHETVEGCRIRVAQFGTSLLPSPWLE
jgi:ribonuclease HI